ncbi:MAG: GNAT family N-acetyltransferase [Lentisphaerales bacterium]|nr:GNAT family N-acetyltransferase [Lentisphaerales bacterium]
MASFDLRFATEKDIYRLFEIYKEVFRWRIDRLFVWADVWQEKRFLSEWPKYLTEVVEIKGEIVGFMQTEEDEKGLFLANIALSSEAQGKKVGAQLIELLKRRSIDTSQRLHLSVFKINERAQSFYRSHGFTMYLETDDTYKMEWIKK